MSKSILYAASFGFALALGAGYATAADQQRTQSQERVYGYDLMTEQERVEHQTRMHNAKTNEEREKIRAEHHEQMQKRAKEKGVTLPDMPPMRGGGMGPGSGMGPGGGMGPGKGGR